MDSTRIGNALILIAALWMAGLALLGPGADADGAYRSMMISTAFALLALLVLSPHLTATWTLLAFSILGVSLSIAAIGTFGVGPAGFVPPILLAMAMWILRDRLDGRVVVWAVILASIGLWAPHHMVAGWYIMALVNAVIWIVNRLKGAGESRQSRLQG